MKCSAIIQVLEELAPLYMACEWDNPGLLAGRSGKEVETVFLAVDATEAAIAQAEAVGADLLLTHHPLIFKGLRQVNEEDFVGRRVLRLIQKDISYYAMHTNFDAAPGCMGALAGEKLGLSAPEVLEPMGTTEDGVPYGIGVRGQFAPALTLRQIAERVKEVFGLPAVTVYGDLQSEEKITEAAVCPGAGGSTVKAALGCGAKVYITGDVSHHEGIDAVAQGMAVIDAGHYGIEHIFMEFMEQFLREKLGGQVKIVREAKAIPGQIL